MTRLSAFVSRVTREMLHTLRRLETGEDCGKFGDTCDEDCDEATVAMGAVLEREVRGLVTRAAGLGRGALGVALWLDDPEPATPEVPREPGRLELAGRIIKAFRFGHGDDYRCSCVVCEGADKFLATPPPARPLAGHTARRLEDDDT